MAAVAPMSQYDKKELAKAKFITGESIQAIADQLDISRRTVERWAAELDEQGRTWRDLRESNTTTVQKVIPIAEAKAKAKSIPTDPTPYRNPPSVRRQKSQVDEFEIVENAIVSLDLLLGSMGGMSDDGRPVDTRGVGGIAGALVKLLEYRRKIQPPSAAELAEQVIALGISPTEFARELREQWHLRA